MTIDTQAAPAAQTLKAGNSTGSLTEERREVEQQRAAENTSFRRIASSKHAQRTLQPLNNLTDNMKPSRSTKSNLRLSIGDPTVDGNLKTPDIVTEAMVDVVRSGKFNGYPPTVGADNLRQVVSTYWRRFCQTKSRQEALKWENVIITSGVSQAIVLALTALCNEGDNILVCAPSFPHYKSVCDSYGIECRYYYLDPSKSWECDLRAAAGMVDSHTKAFVIINPSNPCGSNFSRAHVSDIIDFCQQHQIPLISDEIYAEMVLNNGIFTSVADFDTNVPRLILGGTAKYQVCPGWRVGWSILIDPMNVAGDWAVGMERLTQLIAGVNSICQEAIARTLLKCPTECTEHIVTQLEAGAKVYARLLEHDIGISMEAPQASMFVMLKLNLSYFQDLKSDMEFYEKLLDEENVQVLPGEIFGMSGFLRATVSRPSAVLNEAVDRIIEFCERHKK
ncbi:tyrosine aminotransferase [Leishmania infantum JPCM5]|uniref:Tyrosine_aminotransferase n=2 Tax=Leishmania infantum TaxID=5671 RepID=A0A6L0XRT1_LEIIN|nr:tyrosine aminotransferase [Leishmania infantum JPCM5]CAC9550331.1 tyrosine_aminotransferase [Leishmania infantum]CAM72941.1 tyrosine aminotransferase [Leishmania infantum JPCM5]SUZ46622.1 tyrosine_aminotransferase [Leishmania infantum]|eukprot:XP_001469829.1 tyrosine aminotransferase [Leishmania infantum JPCM5]